jgi:hypothetical protein
VSGAGRAAPSLTCRACGEALTARGPGAAEVRHGTVAAVAIGPVAWVCPRGDDHTPSPDSAAGDPRDRHDHVTPTAAEARDAVRSALDVARRTALRRQLRCGVCDTPFALPGRRTTRTVTITGASPAVTVTFDLPVLRCTDDAVDNVPPEALQDALAATAELLGHDR